MGPEKRRAFTLIELLVVIAIIAILAAILFPVFAQARVSAKTVACISNMKQMGTAVQMYMSDYDDTYCPGIAYEPLSGFAKQKTWVGYDNNNTYSQNGFAGDMRKPAKNPQREGYIQPYLKSYDVERCPMRPPGAQLVVAGNMFSPLDGYNSGAYYRRYPDRRNKEWGPMIKEQFGTAGFMDSRGANASDVQEPSNTLLAWEHYFTVPLCNFLQGEDWFDSPPMYDRQLKTHFQFLHRDAAVVLWADTHAKRMAYGQLRRPMFSSRKDIYE